MTHIGKGLLAGLAATVVLSALMVMKQMMGVMPALDIAKMLAGMMGSPDTPMLGWAIHFLIGVVGYGIAIALLGNRLGSSPTVSGIIIGVLGWLMMMLVLMPMAGAGLFAMSMGAMAPVMTLVLHLVFGAVLGWTFGRLVSGARASAQPASIRFS